TEVKVRTIEAYGQIAVEFADPAWRAGTGQLIGSTFDDRPEDHLVPIVRENVGEELFKIGFVERQRPGLERALSAIELGDDRVFFDPDWCIHGLPPQHAHKTMFCSKDLMLSVLG